MRSSKSMRTFPLRQPAAAGPDVIRNNGGFDVYVDGRYLGSRTTSQNAWIDARAVYFEGVEDSAVAVADDAADWFACGV